MVDMCEIGSSNASKIAGAPAADREAHATTLGRPSFAVEPINGAMSDQAESSASRVQQSQDVGEGGLETVILEGHSTRSRVSTSGGLASLLR